MNHISSKFCGIHAIYIVQVLLNDEKRDMDEIVQYFPKVNSAL